MCDSGRSPATAATTLTSSSSATTVNKAKISTATFSDSNRMQSLSRTVTVCAFMLLLSSTFLLQNVTCMSLDRLGIDRNELLNEQSDGVTGATTDVVVDDMELKAVPAETAGGATDAYVLLPAGLSAAIGGSEQQAAVNENIYDAMKPADETETVGQNAVETSSDMLMMETNESPMVQLVEAPVNIVPESESVSVPLEDGSKDAEKAEEKGEMAEMLPEPQALEGAPDTNSEVAVDMAVVPPESSADSIESSAETLPEPQALVGAPVETVALDEVPAVSDIEQAQDEEKKEEEPHQHENEKVEILSQPQVDEEQIPKEQNIDEEPQNSAESAKTSVESAAEVNEQYAEKEETPANNSDTDATASGENKIIDEMQTENESEPQQSVFGDFPDTIEAVEEEIVADTADEKLPDTPVETKEPEVLQSDEKEAEENKIDQAETEEIKLAENAETVVNEDNEMVASAVEKVNDELAELNPSDNKLTVSDETETADEAEPQPEQNESSPEKSEMAQKEPEAESVSESENENTHEAGEPIADTSLPVDNLVSEDALSSESAEIVKKDKPQKVEEEAVDTELVANDSSETSVQTDNKELEVEKTDLNDTENKEEAKPLEEENTNVVIEQDKKDEVEELQNSVEEEELIAEIPASIEEESNAAEKQSDKPNDVDIQENTANEVVDEVSVVQKDEIPSDEHKEEIIEEQKVDEIDTAKDQEKETIPALEEIKPQEVTVESVDEHKEQIVDEPEIVEQADGNNEKDETPFEKEEQEVQHSSAEGAVSTSEIDKTEETKEEELQQKIYVPTKEEPVENTPQIVEISSAETDQKTTDEEVEDTKDPEAEETHDEKIEENNEPQQTDIKHESETFVDAPEQQQEEQTQPLEQEGSIDITNSDNKDDMEASIIAETHEGEQDIVGSNTETLAAQSDSSTELQPQKQQIAQDVAEENTPEAVAPMSELTAEPVPTDNSDSMLTTIIQTSPQIQQQDVPDIKEPTSDDNAAATDEITDAKAEVAAPQVPATVINEENNEAPPQPIETAEVAPALPVISTQPAPLNVADSVLNYVNASFMNPQSIKPQDETQQQQETQKLQPTATVVGDETEAQIFNSQLRRYDGAQVWRIVVQNDKDRRMADELQTKYGGQLWKEVKQEVDYLLKPQVLSDAARHIRAANLSRIVLIDNLQKVIEVENPPEDEILLLQNRKGHRLTWQAYHRVEDIYGFLDYMAKTYPDICSVETIGYSVEKRPLKILKISNGNANNPGIWIDGGMHAREWIGPATVTYIVNQLVEGWEDLPANMRNINWYVHPMANPDGYEYSHTTDRLWRKNMRSHGRQCPGVDLNRNFGYKWGGKGTSANPCSQTYRGSKAFSEPETFYISKFISNAPRNTFQAYLTFHSYGQYILYPWGYDYAVSADRADLDRVARQAGTSITKSSGGKYTVGPAALTLYPAAGGADDWAKGIAGIKYTYTVEMGDTGRFGFVLPASYIEQNGRDGYTFVETVARAISLGRSTERRRRF